MVVAGYPVFSGALSGTGAMGPFFSSSARPNGEVALGGQGNVAWSPDGARLAVAGSARLHLLTRADLGL